MSNSPRLVALGGQCFGGQCFGVRCLEGDGAPSWCLLLGCLVSAGFGVGFCGAIDTVDRSWRAHFAWAASGISTMDGTGRSSYMECLGPAVSIMQTTRFECLESRFSDRGSATPISSKMHLRSTHRLHRPTSTLCYRTLCHRPLCHRTGWRFTSAATFCLYRRQQGAAGAAVRPSRAARPLTVRPFIV